MPLVSSYEIYAYEWIKTQLRQKDHLSLGSLCHKSDNHSCVRQDIFDEVELLFSNNLDRLDQNSTQEIHQLHITTFPV